MDQRQFDSWYKVGFLASGSNEIGAMPFGRYCSSAVCNEYTVEKEMFLATGLMLGVQ
jgi:hypothetical protein